MRIRLLIAALVTSVIVVMGWNSYDAKAIHQQQHVEAVLDEDWIAIRDIIRRKCNACHARPDHEYPFRTYDSLLTETDEAGRPLVVPGDPDNSALVIHTQWLDALSGNTEPAMPPVEENWLTPQQMVLVSRWIRNGAPQYRPADCESHKLQLDFPSAQECKHCHEREYEEWARSMHAYAQQSPVFEAFNLTVLERTSGTLGTFCTRCHTPLATAQGESGLLRNAHRSRLSLEGITCVACHRRSHSVGRVSSMFAVEDGAVMEACMYGPFDDPVAEEDSHPATDLPYMRTSMFCGSCHDVTNPEGLRLEEAFSEWRNSPAAEKGITCQHCHMGPVPGVPIPIEQRPMGRIAKIPGKDNSHLPLRPLANHTFAGPDYSLLPVTEFPHKLDWMYEVDYHDRSKLTPYQKRTLDDLIKRNKESLAQYAAEREQLFSHAARINVVAPAEVAANRYGKIKIDITSIFEGHNLPTGFTEERQVWLEVLVWDEAGKLIFASGDLDDNADLRDEHSHAVITGKLPHDYQLTNFQSKFMLQTDRGTERPVVIPVNRDVQQVNIVRPATDTALAFGRPGTVRIQKSSLPPTATRTKTYRFKAPDCPQTCYYRVRLRYRHLPPHLLDVIGVPELKPLLKPLELDTAEGVIQITPRRGLFSSRRSSSEVR